MFREIIERKVRVGRVGRMGRNYTGFEKSPWGAEEGTLLKTGAKNASFASKTISPYIDIEEDDEQ